MPEHNKKFVFPTLLEKPERPFKEDTVLFERALRTEAPAFWQKKGEERALKLFHLGAKRIPAYKAFLKTNGVNPDSVKTIKDFSQVPVTDKKNYIQAYELSDRCVDGSLSSSKLIATSSGTSGAPTFWPRGYKQDSEAVLSHDLIYRHLFSIHKHKTLILICFPMGVYVSGVATLIPTWLLTAGYKGVSCVSIGNNKSEALRSLKYLAPEYEQIVLVGHPFFVKEVLETAKAEGLGFLKKKVKAFFCSEGFSEDWREYVAGIAGVKDKFALLNAYGSSEMLLMAQETPASILARKVFDAVPELRQELAKSEATPSLFQYNPLSRFIEVSEKKELLFTAESGIPLIRYNLKDSGQIISYEEMETALSEHRPDWKKEIRDAGYPLWKLPFVTLEGRSDQTIIFYAANIYPENIKTALEHKKYFHLLTGKFTMRKINADAKEQFLEINVELAPNVKPSLVDAKMLARSIFEKLKEVNMEYADAVSHSSKDLRPRVNLWPYQHEKYFRSGLKPKFII